MYLSVVFDVCNSSPYCSKFCFLHKKTFAVPNNTTDRENFSNNPNPWNWAWSNFKIYFWFCQSFWAKKLVKFQLRGYWKKWVTLPNTPLIFQNVEYLKLGWLLKKISLRGIRKIEAPYFMKNFLSFYSLFALENLLFWGVKTFLTTAL